MQAELDKVHDGGLVEVLVTGHRGFIGNHLIEELIKKDYTIYGLDLPEGDIRLELPKHRFSYIYHLAAKKSVPLSEKIPYEFVTTNCWGTLNLLRSYPNSRFINISSSSANENKSIYGMTKSFGEMYANKFEHAISVRLYNVFGEGQPVESGALIPSLCMARILKENPVVYGDGEQRRDFTYVKDVVKSIVYAGEKLYNVNHVHFGYGISISVNDLVSTICPLLNPEYLPSRSFDIVNSCSINKLPVIEYGRELGIKRTVEWYENTLSP